jgi:hypothetical protein
MTRSKSKVCDPAKAIKECVKVIVFNRVSVKVLKSFVSKLVKKNIDLFSV